TQFVSSAAHREEPNVSPSQTKVTEGNFESLNIKWYPDSHISYITFPDGKRRYFISGDQKTYVVESPTSLPLNEVLKNNPKTQESFGPNLSVTYRNKYS